MPDSEEHPTLAIDFTAHIEGDSIEHCLRATAKAIVANGSHIGERVFADVVKNSKTRQFETLRNKTLFGEGTIHDSFQQF